MDYKDWDRQDVLRALTEARITGANVQIARYWFSLWNGERPPSRARFEMAKVAQRAPAIALFERRGPLVTCVKAGNFLRFVLGIDLTGRDLMALTPEDQRDRRLQNIAAVLDGAVACAMRSILGADGAEQAVQEILLPFGDVAMDGSQRWLFHSNWQPQGEDWLLGAAKATAGIAPVQRIVAFTRAAAPAAPQAAAIHHV